MEEIPTGSEEIICEQEEREVGLDLILTHDHLKTLIDKRTDEGSEEGVRSEDGQREGRRGGRGRGREKEEEGDCSLDRPKRETRELIRGGQ
jgi:hypothetical protein